MTRQTNLQRAAWAALVVSVLLVALGLWGAIRKWDADDGLLAAAVGMAAIAYALLTYLLLRTGQDQVAALHDQVRTLQDQIAEERISREQEREAANRADELAKATLRESTRGRLSSQAPSVTVRLVDVRCDWYQQSGSRKKQVPGPDKEVLSADWPGLSMNLVMSLDVENHGPGVAIMDATGLLQDDALWPKEWSDQERRAKTKALRQGEVVPIALQLSDSARGWWKQAREGFGDVGVQHVEGNRSLNAGPWTLATRRLAQGLDSILGGVWSG